MFDAMKRKGRLVYRHQLPLMMKVRIVAIGARRDSHDGGTIMDFL